MRRLLVGAVLTFALVGCGDDSGDDDSDDDVTDGAVRDGGADGGDAGRGDAGIDGGGGTMDSGVDAARPDATIPSDASTDAARSDASTTTDAGGLDAGGGGDAGGGDAGGDAGTVTFSSLYTSIFQPTCAGCHTASHRTGLSFASEQAAYDSLVGDPAGTGAMGMGSACDNTPPVPVRVVAGSADTSLLVDKVEADPACGNRMPPNAAPLSATDIARIRTWINAGAAR